MPILLQLPGISVALRGEGISTAPWFENPSLRRYQ